MVVFLFPEQRIGKIAHHADRNNRHQRDNQNRHEVIFRRGLRNELLRRR